MFYYMMGKLGKTELSTFFVKAYEYKNQADIQKQLIIKKDNC